jgi:hypothetical protein
VWCDGIEERYGIDGASLVLIVSSLQAEPMNTSKNDRSLTALLPRPHQIP